MSKKTPDNDKIIPFIRNLCPDLDEVQLKEAEERLIRYLKLSFEIFEREHGKDRNIDPLV